MHFTKNEHCRTFLAREERDSAVEAPCWKKRKLDADQQAASSKVQPECPSTSLDDSFKPDPTEGFDFTLTGDEPTCDQFFVEKKPHRLLFLKTIPSGVQMSNGPLLIS